MDELNHFDKLCLVQYEGYKRQQKHKLGEVWMVCAISTNWLLVQSKEEPPGRVSLGRETNYSLANLNSARGFVFKIVQAFYTKQFILILFVSWIEACVHNEPF